MEAEKKAIRQMENFRKKHLVVCILEKNGKRSSFEALLTGTLLEFGITIKSLSKNDSRMITNGDTSPLKDGFFALVGSSWKNRSDYGDLYTHCEYRLLAADNKILVSGYDYCFSSDEKTLTYKIVKYILNSKLETLENLENKKNKA